MASRGRRRRGRSWGTSQAPPGFDQQAFIENMGAAFTTIAHTSAVGGQGGGGGGGGSSNLWRFKVHHPLTFMGGGDSMLVDHWF